MRRQRPEVLPSDTGSGRFRGAGLLQQHRQKLTVSCRKASRIMVSDRPLGTTLCHGTIPVFTGSLGAATFPRIIRISCTRLPECHP
jgi:hypothetical protein